VDDRHRANAESLTRIRSLLAGLPGPLGNGEMFAWVHAGDVESVPQDVFALLEGASGRLERWGPSGGADGVPASAEDLMTGLSQVEETVAADFLVWLLTTTMAYGGAGRYAEGKARDVVRTLAGLLGYGAQWWVNGEPLNSAGARGWWPVTRCTFDALVVGAGNGVIVTVLAVDED
jgi:hypothetical protein